MQIAQALKKKAKSATQIVQELKKRHSEQHKLRNLHNLRNILRNAHLCKRLTNKNEKVVLLISLLIKHTLNTRVHLFTEKKSFFLVKCQNYSVISKKLVVIVMSVMISSTTLQMPTETLQNYFGHSLKLQVDDQ